MMTPEMLASMASYEASLPGSSTPSPESAPSVAELTADATRRAER